MARILIAEDDDILRTVLGTVLKGAGHEITAVSDGSKAWALIEQGQRFDAIISDNNMPRMDGTELLRKVRESCAYSGVRFTLMSGRDSLPNGKRLADLCSDFGARFFLKGSFRPNDLIQEGLH